MNIEQRIKELRDRYQKQWDERDNNSTIGSFQETYGFIPACDVASDLDNILLVRSPARSGALSDDSKEGEA